MNPHRTPAPAPTGKPAPPKRMHGRKFHLPPGYSLGTLPGRQFRFTRSAPGLADRFASEPYGDPEEATRAAWAHAGLPAPAKICEWARRG